MDEGAVLALALVLFAWAVLSERLARFDLTGPMVLLVAGFVLGNRSWGLVAIDVDSATVHRHAEITLVLVLFTDASKVRLADARRDLGTTVRLLGIGLPLTIVAGTALAVVAFPDVPVALAAVVGAGLAPTDAALVASVITDPRVPAPVRRVLNVESGLNDGIATPVVTGAIVAAATALGIATHGADDGLGGVGELVVAVAGGAAIGVLGGRVVGAAHRRGWCDEPARQLAVLALAVLVPVVVDQVGGNPFVAAFVGGLVFGAADPVDAPDAVELTETIGWTLALALWFTFGAGFVLPALERLDGRTVLYAVLSLTVIRMVPVALSLVGTARDRATTAFIGWFGPRGLASAIFALLAVEVLGGSDPRVVVAIDAITVTILLSVVLHGLTARPLSARFGATGRTEGGRAITSPG